MSIADDITNAVTEEPKPPKATPEVAAILKAADLAAEPRDLRMSRITTGGGTNADLDMPAYVYRDKRKKLTRIVMEEICNAIRGGAMEYVAAEAAGINKEAFDLFMLKFPKFRSNVIQAHAQCRAQLEQDVAKKKPLEWLLKGPGRHQPNRPGWTAQTAITGADGGNIQHQVTHKVDLSRLSEAQLLEMKQLMEVAEKLEEKTEVVDAEFKEIDKPNE